MIVFKRTMSLILALAMVLSMMPNVGIHVHAEELENETEIVAEVPTEQATQAPVEVPTEAPTEKPTEAPTEKPTEAPEVPTDAPTQPSETTPPTTEAPVVTEPAVPETTEEIVVTDPTGETEEIILDEEFLAGEEVVEESVSATLNLGVTGLTVEYTTTYNSNSVLATAGSASCKLSNGNVVATASSYKGTFTGYTVSTVKITLKNTGYKKAILTFSYSGPDNGGSATNHTNTKVTLGEEESHEIELTSSGSSTSKTTLTLSNIALEEVKVVEVTFKVPSNGSYSVNNETITVEKKLTADDYSMAATSASGYKFFGWYNETTGKYVSYTEDTNLVFTDSATIYPVFVAENSPVFGVAGERFYDLTKACEYATANNAKQIDLLCNGTLPAGEYTIPSGVTLLIPYDANYTLQTTSPKTIAHTESPYHVAPKAFRTLTMAAGAKITVESGAALSVAGQQNSVMKYNGMPYSDVGFIKMNDGSSIVVDSGANLYAWGYIIGSGLVEIKSGGTVYEDFQLADFRGGDVTTQMIGKSQRVFPMSQYYIQNIEVPLKLHAGASEMALMAANITLAGIQKCEVPVVSKSGGNAMFQISSGYIIKDYNEEKDRIDFTTAGDISVSSISMSMKMSFLGTATINSKDYYLPIPSHFTINAISGNVQINQDIVLLPGAEMIVAESVTGTLGAGNDIVLYDAADWGNYCYNNTATGAKYVVLPHAPGRKNPDYKDRDKDALVELNGTMDASQGAAYTTTGGANVYSTGAGKVKVKPGNDTKVYVVTQNSTNITYVDIAMNSAWLKNGNGEYVKTVDRSGNTTYQYCNKAGHELWYADDECPICRGGVTITWHVGEETITSVCDYGTVPTYPGDLPQKEIDYEWHYITGWSTTIDGVALENLPPAKGDMHYYVVYTPEGHQDVGVDTPPTCTESGYTTWTCAVCGDSYVDEDSYVDALGHTEVVDVAVAPTCTATGLTEGKHCSVCNEVFVKQEVVAALGHNHTNAAVYTNLNNGNHSVACGDCGVIITESEGHSYGADHKCVCTAVEKYTVIWTDENGDVIRSETVEYGKDAVDAPALPSKPGYTGVWSNSSENVTGQTTIQATYTANSYSISWIVDGVVHTASVVKYDSAIELPAAEPVKTGHAFAGWYTGENGTGNKITGKTIYTFGNVGDPVAAVAENEEISGNTTLYAHFIPNTYNATFNANGGAWGEETTKTVPTVFGEAIVAPADPERTGYEFKGWDLEVGTMDVEGKTFTANWECLHLTTEAEDNGDGTHDVVCENDHLIEDNTPHAYAYNAVENKYLCVCKAEEKIELPEVVITDIKDTLTDSDPDLTFALNFAIKDLETLSDEYLEKLLNVYGHYYTDYVLTISGLSEEEGNVTFNADGTVDGYLAGQYDAWSENWVAVPFGDDVTVQNGESLYIMEYAAKLMGKDGLRVTLKDIAEVVQNFDCGVYFTPEFLAANPNLKVTLELKVYTEDAEGNKTQDISVAENEFTLANIAAIVAHEGKQTKYCDSLAAAYEAAEADDTIMLMADAEFSGKVEIAKNITIDVNGHKITAEEAIDVSGKLTIVGETAVNFKLTNAEATITGAEGLNVATSLEGYRVVYADGKHSLSNIYTITWNVDGEVYKTTEQAYGEALKLPGEPTKEGYDFLGWFTAEENGEQVTDETVFTNANNNTVYYAQWQCLHQTTEAKDNGNGTHTVTCACGATIDAAANHTYNFKSTEKQYKCDCGAVEKIELPAVAVEDIKDSLKDTDPDLTFALNFAIKDLENLSEEYLEKLLNVYGHYYTDYVLTIEGLSEESVTFNADGEADGYLAGQYDNWNENWVTVPFENVTVKNGESLYIMETAAGLLGQSGLRVTLKDIAEVVQNFDCGVYFTPEFLAANPDLEVTLELKVYTEDDQGNDSASLLKDAIYEFTLENIAAVVECEGKQTEYCASLDAAITAAEAGDTVILLKDAVLTETLTIDKNITIDGNNHSITGNVEVSGEVTVTVKEVASAKVVLTDAAAAITGENLTVTSGVENYYVVVSENGTHSLSNIYTITWNVDGQTYNTTKQAYGETLDLPADPTKAGYDFIGWFTAEEGGTKVTNETVFSNANNETVYYAQWECLHKTTEATDNKDGTHTVTCSCGEVLKSSEDHTYTFSNEKRYECVCGAVEKIELPAVAVNDIKAELVKDNVDPDLTFALNFAIAGLENAGEEYLKYLEKVVAVYGDYYTDYVLTIEGLNQESVTFNANGEADGYLAGQYDAWSENWVTVPFENVTVKNGESLYIMETAAGLLGQSGLRVTLKDIAEVVQNFDCGVYFTPEFLAANPDLEVTLELKVYTEDDQGNDSASLLKDAIYEFTLENIAAVVECEGKQTEYCASLDAAITAADEGDTVALVKDAEITGDVTIDKAITIDLNGCELTSEKEIEINVSVPVTVVGEPEVTFVLTDADATITGVEGLRVETELVNHRVVYENGTHKADDYAVTVTGENKFEYYDSLTAAYAAAKDGDTITLYADAKLTGKLTIEKAVTIDGNGYSIIADETAVWYTTGSKPLYLKQYKTHLIGVNSNGVMLKNITLDCNNNAAGINVYCAQNVVFDNVSIINATKGMAGLTVNGSTLTAKNALTILGNSIAIDISNGSNVTSALGMTVEDGTVFDLGNKTVKFASVAVHDLSNAVDANGAPYFAAMDNAYYYTQTQIDSRTSGYSNGLKLLTDVTLKKDTEIKGTLDLNGHTMMVAVDKFIIVTGDLAVDGETSAKFKLTKANATITAPEGLYVESGVENYRVIYADGKYSLSDKYMVTFTINGEIYGEPVSVKYGEAVVAPAYDIPEGHTFSGWSVPEIMPAEDRTLDATLTINSYEVIFTINGEVYGEPVSVKYGDAVTAPAYEVAEGYYFSGWTTPATMPADNITLDAVLKQYVAEVNGEKYTDLHEAAAVSNGATVTLLADVVLEASIIVDDTVVLDLAGYTVSCAESWTENGAMNQSLILVKRGGDVTINDSSKAQTGTLNAEKRYTAVSLTHKGEDATGVAAKVTVNGGKLIGKWYAICGNGLRDNTEITVNGGELIGNEWYGIYHPQMGKLTINDGTIHGKECAVGLLSGELVITGGTLESENSVALLIKNHNDTGYQPITGVSITGGEFIGAEGKAAVDSISANGANAITGFITGGTYSSDVSELCAENYTADEIEDGKWGIVKTFTVTWVAEDVTVDTEIVIEGKAPTKTPAVPEKTGYTGAWEDAPTAVTENVTIEAIYTANVYKITWKNGEDVETTEQTFNAQLILPATEPTKEGYTFQGWFTEEGEQVTDKTVFTNANDDTVYYAQWQCQHTTTKLKDNGDGTHTVTCTSGCRQELERVNHEFKDGLCACGAMKLLRGDVDLDGDVDAHDLTMLTRHMAGVETITNDVSLMNADVTLGDQVTVADQTLLAQYVGGIITSWPENP